MSQRALKSLIIHVQTWGYLTTAHFFQENAEKVFFFFQIALNLCSQHANLLITLKSQNTHTYITEYSLLPRYIFKIVGCASINFICLIEYDLSGPRHQWNSEINHLKLKG